ncbi:kinase-like domain-containing protein [Gigaspora rosea]|uniref:Kinase-like domain-containing protein n=1 Tax=Gigaspora rosea TaxID=44941 RepID=A0A397VHJ8_9GLOM|nr:kinase-like domain-containing protein [Gigaspora rosea]
MDWKDKLNLLQCIASDLQIIHSHDLIHRDLHSGNILLNSFKSAYIADLGLSISANIMSKSKCDGIYGIIPYVAPEVLNNQPYTKASDIYSFGIIMWEILYGKAVLYNQKLDMSQLCFLICYRDLRPAVNNGAPQCYVNLMKKCWDKNSEKRSSAKDLCEIFDKWQNDESVLFKLNESNQYLRILKIRTMRICSTVEASLSIRMKLLKNSLKWLYSVRRLNSLIFLMTLDFFFLKKNISSSIRLTLN